MRRTRSLTRGKEAHDGVLCRARCTAANPPSTREVRVGSNATELGLSVDVRSTAKERTTCSAHPVKGAEFVAVEIT
jgi:hypothetical protein